MHVREAAHVQLVDHRVGLVMWMTIVAPFEGLLARDDHAERRFAEVRSVAERGTSIEVRRKRDAASVRIEQELLAVERVQLEGAEQTNDRNAPSARILRLRRSRRLRAGCSTEC